MGTESLKYMYFVHKKSLQPNIRLTCQEIDILNQPSKNERPGESEFIEKLLALKKDYWIACGCNNFKSMVVICKKYVGALYLRTKNKNEHNNLCIFYNNEFYFIKKKIGLMKPFHPNEFFSLYTQNEFLTLEKISSKKNNQFQVTSKLGKILYALIEESNLNKVNATDFLKLKNEKKFNQIQFLYENTKNKMISDDIFLKDYLHFSISENSLDYAEKKLKQARWPNNLKPFVLFLCWTNKVSPLKIMVEC